MGSCLPPATTHHRHLYLHLQARPNSTTFSPPIFTSLAPLYNHSRLTTNHLRIDSSIRRNLRLSFPVSTSSPTRRSDRRCRATSPEPPPSSGVMSILSGVQDAVRIFLAVLFWMSLFFWSCVWNGRNDGRPNNGSRFKR